MSFWYPFRSREVRDIITHLTPEEHTALAVIAKREGEQVAWRVVMPGSFISTMVIMACTRGLHVIPATLLIAVVFSIYFLITWKVTRPLRARLNTFLCNTSYAQRMGYRPETLPRYRLDLRGLLRA